MKALIEALFPQGHRKLVVSVIALAVGVVLEKFGGGLTPAMRDSLIAIVAIFVTGNVGEHLADALKFLKGTKVGQIIEDVVPGDQGLGESRGMAMQAPEEEDEVEARMLDLEKKLAVQSQNIGQIVQILNQMRTAASGQTQPPR